MDFAARGVVKTVVRCEKMEKLPDVSPASSFLDASCLVLLPCCTRVVGQRRADLRVASTGVSRNEGGKVEWTGRH